MVARIVAERSSAPANGISASLFTAPIRSSLPQAAEPAGLATLLLQAQLLLADANEANGTGDYGTFALQRQAREVLAEAIDRLTFVVAKAEVSHG